MFMSFLQFLSFRVLFKSENSFLFVCLFWFPVKLRWLGIGMFLRSFYDIYHLNFNIQICPILGAELYKHRYMVWWSWPKVHGKMRTCPDSRNKSICQIHQPLKLLQNSHHHHHHLAAKAWSHPKMTSPIFWDFSTPPSPLSPILLNTLME